MMDTRLALVSVPPILLPCLSPLEVYREFLSFLRMFLLRPRLNSLISSNSCGTALFSDGTHFFIHYCMSCALTLLITRLLQQCHWNGYVLSPYTFR